MRFIIPLLFFVQVSSYSYAEPRQPLNFDYSIVVGKWAALEKKLMGNDWYLYFEINSDYEGSLVSEYGYGPQRRDFSSDEVLFHDGYLEIKFSSYERFIFSGWKIGPDNGKLAGMLFLYMPMNDSVKNMTYFPLELVTEQSELLSNDQLKQLFEGNP